jgi:hypothetical protein
MMCGNKLHTVLMNAERKIGTHNKCQEMGWGVGAFPFQYTTVSQITAIL